MAGPTKPATAKSRSAVNKRHKPATVGSKSPGKASKKTASATARRDDLARQLVQELGGLRTTCREIVQAYELRVGAQIAALVDALSNQAAPEEQTRPPDAKRLTAALASVRGLKLKPKKGRAKDLAHLQQLAEKLTAALGEP
jgi:hypothetical protein